MEFSSEKIKILKEINREIVNNDYQSALKKNQEMFFTGNVKASSEYIFENQKYDALTITNKFYDLSIRCVSIIKRTKVGMDGLMIEIAKNISTHPDDNFMLDRNNIFFITAMSNVSWETDLKEKLPLCFKENIYHHGKLQRFETKLNGIKNSLIIIDEIDTGDKEEQKLHKILKKNGILDIKYMENYNIRFVFVSATMFKESKDLEEWGEKHYTHHMTIPDSYISHKDFLELGIIQEFYPINDDESAEKWIREDILKYYVNDFRIHIIRTDEKNKDFIFNACKRNGIDFRNHTYDDKITFEELSSLFNNIIKHLIIAVKGFYRRSNLIPNEWKKKIGATHEKYVKNYDTNVQVQGLPGRMTGYWKDIILNGHKTGPHRTSIKSIYEYEEFYKNPFGKIKYCTSSSKDLFLNKKHIKNLSILQHNIEDNDEKIFKRIPIIIEGLDKNDIIFQKCISRKEKINYILSITNNEKYKKLYKFITNPYVKCIQISKPITDKSYKTHIIDAITSSKNDNIFSIDLKKEDKNISNWQVFIDEKEKRLVFILWSLDKSLL